VSPFLGTRGAGSNRAFGYAGAAAPAQVTGLTATDFGTSRAYNNGRIDLSWNAPANNGATISGYLIQRSTDGSTYSTLVSNTGSSATTYSDTSLLSNQIYYYRVSAINAAGTGLASTAANATSTTVPQAPTVSAANVGTGRAYNNGAATVTVSGGATGGKAISSYTATSSPGSFTATSGSPLTVTGLQSATAYTFSVTATNANGTSTATVSNSITATTVPQAPTIGTATAGTESASITFTGNATGGSTITTYTMTSNPGSVTGTGAASPITVSSLTAGTAYTFTVTATNANGTSTASAASNSITPTAPYFVGMAYESAFTTSGFRRGWDTTRTDSSGNIYIAGTNFDNSSGTERRFGYIAKMNPSGVVQWQKNITGDAFEVGSGNYNRIYRIDVSSSGNVYATGGVKVSVGTGDYHYIMKFNTSGTLQWSRRLIPQSGNGSTNDFNINTVTIDSSENVYVSVSGTVSGVGQSFCNIFKFDSSGTELWKRQIQNTYSDNGSRVMVGGIAVDSSGNVFVTGKSQLGNANYVLFAGKYNSSGTSQWVRSITPPGGSRPSLFDLDLLAARVDSTGAVYFAGKWVNSSGGQPGCLLKYDTNGSLLWQREIRPVGVAAESIFGGVNDMVIDSSDNLWLVGRNRTSGPLEAGFIVKYNTSGTLTGNWLFRTSSYTNEEQGLRGIGLDSSANLYVCGLGFARASGQPPYYAISFAKLPNDGSRSGTYTVANGGGFVWGTTNQVESANGSGTSATPTEITLGNSGTTTTSTTPALTIGDATLTFGKTNI
jgi:hypothetical protein